MKYDNAIIHYYPLSPFVAKVNVNIRCGSKIALRVPIKNVNSAYNWIDRVFPGIEYRIITHM